MIRKVRNCCETCENLVCVATTIGQLQHTEYLKPTFLDTFKWAIRPIFPETVTYTVIYYNLIDIDAYMYVQYICDFLYHTCCTEVINIILKFQHLLDFQAHRDGYPLEVWVQRCYFLLSKAYNQHAHILYK